MGAVETDWILLAQAAATLYMTGLIWFVQVVHYPLMDRVGNEGFARYHEAHARLTAWVVGPPMLVEGVTAAVVVFRPPPGVPTWQVWLGLTLVALIWLSTAVLQVPQHRRLGGGLESDAHRRLVVTNWARVAGWSARSLLLLHWLA